MNCMNHPEAEVSAYCQNCGKALCTQCVRPVAGVVYCEPCLAAKLSGARPAAGAPPVDVRGTFQAAAAAGVAPGHANPVLAGFLGLIPGVGAMYNGQFIKALIHVLVFVVLIGITDHFDAAGLLIAAWIFYQVFDAAQTATARRDGLPIPDPIGINAFVERLGIPGQAVPVASTASASAYRASSAAYGAGAVPAGYTTVPGEPVPPSGAQSSTADPSAMPPPPGASWQEWAHRAAVAKGLRDAGIPVTGAEFDPNAGAGARTCRTPAARMRPAPSC